MMPKISPGRIEIETSLSASKTLPSLPRDVFEFDHEGINGSDISEMSENTNCQQTSRQFVVEESIDWSVLLGAE